jgi:hypothetical protein
LNSKNGRTASLLVMGFNNQVSKITQGLMKLNQKLRESSKIIKTNRKSNELEGKVFKGVKWQDEGKSDFGNIVISETELTFFKNLTDYTNKILFLISVSAIHAIKLDDSIEDQLTVDLQYVNSNGEASIVRFYSIMDTFATGQEMYNRIQQYRTNH